MQVLRPLRTALVGFSPGSRTLQALENALRRQHAYVTRLDEGECDTLHAETDCVFINARVAERAGDRFKRWRENSRALWIAVPEADGVPAADQGTGLLMWAGTHDGAALSTRGAGAAGGVLRFETLVLDCDACELEAHGRLHRLNAAETALMELLIRNPGRIISPETIGQHCFGCGSHSRTHISALVSRLRRKVELGPGPPRWIRTVYNRGYRLVSPLLRPAPPRATGEDARH